MSLDQSRWHPDDAVLTAYMEGSTTMAVSTSVEQHLVACSRCRASVAALSDPAPLDAIWDRIAVDISAPARPRLEAALARAGLPEHDAILVRSAPAMRGSWILGILLCLLFATLAAMAAGQRAPILFLWTAPMVPVLAVAMAFGQDADPAWELAVASPYPPLRLILLRAGAVIATAVPVTALAAVFLPGPAWVTVAWLLPSLAGVALTLALATWWPVTHAAAGVALTWFGVSGSVALDRRSAALDILAADLLPAYVVIAVIAGVVFALRADHLTRIGGTA